MNEIVKISDIKLSSGREFNELSATVDGDHIFFKAPKTFELFLVAECFVGIALLEAMVSNRSLLVEGVAISEALKNNLVELQAIYSCWNADLSRVEVHAETTSQVQPYRDVGSFFSAGVDSTYTLQRHIDEITHLILFRAFDSGHDPESWRKRVEKQAEFAQSIDKKIIPIETNAFDWTDGRKIASEFVHGLLLSSVGGALGMRKVYVPSSHTYDELFPWGSHPLSDPMWSTESTEVKHDAAGLRRGEKMKEILTNSRFADNLQTCWRSTVHNCGTCPKCARSVLAIYLLGGTSKAFPEFQGNDNLLHMLKAKDESGATFLEDAMILAKKSGNEKIYNTLKGYYRQYQLSLLPPLIDRCLLNNSVRRVYRKLKQPDWLRWRVTMRGANRWDI